MTDPDKAGYLDYSSNANENFSWDDYDRHRPNYPVSFWNRIWDYHTAHSNTWESAHDIGTGQGLAAAQLAQKFKHVAASDPNQKFLDVAEGRLNKGAMNAKFSFGLHRAEDEWLPPNSQDFVACVCALHWTNPLAAVESIAKSMKPGATLFITLYFRPVVVDNVSVQQAWNELWDETFRSGKMMAPKPPLRVRDVLQSAGDAVEFPETLFEPGVKRIKINAQGEDAFVCNHLDSFDYDAVSEVGPNDQIEYIEEEGYAPDGVGLDWFKGAAVSMNPTFTEETFDWEGMKTAIDAVGGRAKVGWPIAVILATKKS